MFCIAHAALHYSNECHAALAAFQSKASTLDTLNERVDAALIELEDAAERHCGEPRDVTCTACEELRTTGQGTDTIAQRHQS